VLVSFFPVVLVDEQEEEDEDFRLIQAQLQFLEARPAPWRRDHYSWGDYPIDEFLSLPKVGVSRISAVRVLRGDVGRCWNGVKKSISVLLVDDHAVVRQGLRALLAAEDDIEVVGEAANGREAVRLAKQTSPELILMDVAMPLLNGFEATRQILKAIPATKVLVLSSYRDDDYVQRMLQAGAGGYLLKETAATDLLRAIRQVHQGKRFFSPSIARRFGEGIGSGAAPRPPTAPAREPTPREAEVVQLIAEGLSNKQIAAELRVSIKTVEKHRQGVMDKLNIHDIAGLTRYAMAKGLVEPRHSLDL
jgi:DNA-binding NarL/FixJ family response regulator